MKRFNRGGLVIVVINNNNNNNNNNNINSLGPLLLGYTSVIVWL